jgi:hypothetical protein
VSNKSIQYAGEKFGRLTVIEFVKKDAHGSTYWLCSCACGKEVVTRLKSITRGTTKSCGCLARELVAKRTSLPNNLAIKRRAYRTHLIAAKKRGLKSNLTQDDYISIASKPCFYCGGFSIRRGPRKKIAIQFNSVDRYNNEPFYSLENSVSSCLMCQRFKSNFLAEVFIKHCHAVELYQRSLKEVANGS